MWETYRQALLSRNADSLKPCPAKHVVWSPNYFFSNQREGVGVPSVHLCRPPGAVRVILPAPLSGLNPN